MWVTSLFQDVSFKWHQVVIGKVCDVSFCITIATQICLHWQKLCCVFIPGDKIQSTRYSEERTDPEAAGVLWENLRVLNKEMVIWTKTHLVLWQEQCVSDTPTHTQGRKRCSGKFPVCVLEGWGWGGGGGKTVCKITYTYKSKRRWLVENSLQLFFLNTHKCSAESVDDGLSFSSRELSSNTMVSVLARQNPLDLMISVYLKEASLALIWAGICHGKAWLHPLD